MHEFLPLTCDEVRGALASWRAGGRPGVPKAEPAKHAWPGGAAAVVTGDGAGMECRTLLWGFNPPTGTRPVFNARLEKLVGQEAPGSRFWANARRCLVPTRMFWEPSDQGDVPFCVPGMPVFLMAGVWEGDRFAVVTVPASPDIMPLHPRMPLVLPAGFSREWLLGAVPARSPQVCRADGR